MKKITLLVLLALVGTACGQAAPAPAPTAAPTAIPSPTLAPLPVSTSTPAFTPTPTLTPTDTATSTPSTPMVEATTQTVNCRYGPGLDYLPVGTLPPGQWIPIDASTGDQSWWRIELPNSPGTYCWIGSSLTQTTGDLNQVQVVTPPGGIVIGVTVSADTAEVIGPCSGSNTNNFRGTLTINGPGEVLYHWEIANAAGQNLDSSSTMSLVFHTNGTQAVGSWSFTGGCGDYVVSLIATDPNIKSATFSYKAVP